MFPEYSCYVLYYHIYIRVCNFHWISHQFSHLNMCGGIMRITSFDLSVIAESTVY